MHVVAVGEGGAAVAVRVDVGGPAAVGGVGTPHLGIEDDVGDVQLGRVCPDPLGELPAASVALDPLDQTAARMMAIELDGDPDELTRLGITLEVLGWTQAQLDELQEG